MEERRLIPFLLAHFLVLTFFLYKLSTKESRDWTPVMVSIVKPFFVSLERRIRVLDESLSCLLDQGTRQSSSFLFLEGRGKHNERYVSFLFYFPIRPCSHFLQPRSISLSPVVHSAFSHLAKSFIYQSG